MFPERDLDINDLTVFAKELLQLFFGDLIRQIHHEESFVVHKRVNSFLLSLDFLSLGGSLLGII